MSYETKEDLLFNCINAFDRVQFLANSVATELTFGGDKSSVAIVENLKEMCESVVPVGVT